MGMSKEQQRIYNKNYRAKNLQKHREYMKQWGKDNKKRISDKGKIYRKTEAGVRSRRSAMLRFKYGIELSDYERMYSEQGGSCAICRNPKELLCVDHCHTTGKVRGLICSFCNMAVAVVEKDGFLERIYSYLQD
jgi:hypothetical protein